MPASHFDEFLEGKIAKASNRLPKTLNLVHGTTALKLRNILDEGKIRPNHCKVIGQDVIFTFYARPAYKPPHADQLMYEPLNAPVYILFDNSVLSQAITGFPFDSGAFEHELYRRFIHPELTLKDFKFTPSELAIKALVECYFEDNDRYLLNAPLALPNVDKDDFEANEFKNVLQRKNVDDALDDRASSIEVGLASEVNFTSKNIKAIFLPQALADGKKIVKPLQELGIKIHFYDFFNGFSWNQYAALIMASVKRYYADQGLL